MRSLKKRPVFYRKRRRNRFEGETENKEVESRRVSNR